MGVAKMFTIRRSITLVLISVLTFGAFSVNSASAQTKSLVIGIAENTTSLDPARGFEPEGGIIEKAAYDTLVTFPPDNVTMIIPKLATKWVISSDGLTYTFTLKDGIVFSTGNPMTADDVVFSWNRLIGVKGTPSFLASTIASVKASNSTTVVLTLNAPDHPILAKLVYPAFAVTDSKTIMANGGTTDANDQAESWLDHHSVGTGPYILTKWDKNNQTVLVKNPKKNAPPPASDQVILRDMPQAATQNAALEAGDIDIALDLTPDQSAIIKSKDDLKLYEGVSNTGFFLIMNQDKTIGGPLSDAKVQKAVRLALDYDGI